MHVHIFNIISRFLPSRYTGIRRWILRRCGISVETGVSIAAGVQVYGSRLKLGTSVWISPEVVFATTVTAGVSIGENSDIGHGAWFVCGTHQVGGPERRAGQGQSRDIEIGPGCWVGARATILGGALVGSGTIIGAGSLVLPGLYPPNILLAGVPAVLKKRLGN